MTEEYEDQLEQEAEVGFEPSSLQRRPGRPSLSGRPGRSTRLDLRVDDSTYTAILRVAHEQHRNVSDVVREAINRYLAAS